MALGAAWIGLSPSAAADRPIGLEEAILMALRNNEGIAIQREEAASSVQAIVAARGAYDPLFQAQGGWRRAAEPVNSAFSGAPAGRLSPTLETAQTALSVTQRLPTGGEVTFRALATRETTDEAFALLSPSWGTQVGIEMRQPLLRDRALDGTRFAIRAARADRAGADAALRSVVNETIASVEQVYWTLAAARQEVGVQEEAVRLAEEQLAETNARVENGAAPETEVAQPRAEIERRRGEMIASKEAVSRAENALKRLILRDDDEAAWLDRLAPAEPADLEIAPLDLPAAMTRALSTRPELAQAESTLERRRAESALADDGVKPSLDAIASYDRLGFSGSENPDGAAFPGVPVIIPDELDGGLGRSFATLGEGDFDDARVAVVFGIPIGNRSARAVSASARHRARQAEAELTRLRKAIRAEVLDAAAALETAAQRIEASRAAREAAEVQLASERDRYSVGLSTNFLVLTRQNDLSRARLAEIAARTDYRVARAAMARATGSLPGEHALAIDDGTPAGGDR